VRIQPLKQDIIHLEDKITETDMRTDDLEQYGRRHSLRISGIPESHKEHTDMLICEFLKNELNIESITSAIRFSREGTRCSISFASISGIPTSAVTKRSIVSLLLSAPRIASRSTSNPT
jgi:hypothetical protein